MNSEQVGEEGRLAAPGAFAVAERETRLQEIWQDDLLHRQKEARDLADYLSLRLARIGEGAAETAFTLAVDAPYGEGKTFFLERLSQQLSIDHPVAFVNAWADDTADQPLTALFVAIGDALKARTVEEDSPAWMKLKKNSTKLLGLAGKAGLKGLAARVLTKEGLEEFADASKGLLDDVYQQWANEEVNTYRQRRQSIHDFKLSLRDRINEIEEIGAIKRPVFVFVDELDRCRPTYAIRMLEEIKHLFDSSAVAFVLGTSRKALTPSIKAVYGNEFQAEEYLHRFIQRTYYLERPSLRDFIFYKLKSTSVDLNSLNLHGEDPPEIDDRLKYYSSYISEVARANGRAARDVEQILEYIFSFVSIWPHKEPVQLGYLLPIILQHHFGITTLSPSKFSFNFSGRNGGDNFGYERLFDMFENRSQYTFREILEYHGWSSNEFYVRNTLQREGEERGGNVFFPNGSPKDDPSQQKPRLSEYKTRVNSVARLIQ